MNKLPIDLQFKWFQSNKPFSVAYVSEAVFACNHVEL